MKQTHLCDIKYGALYIKHFFKFSWDNIVDVTASTFHVDNRVSFHSWIAFILDKEEFKYCLNSASRIAKGTKLLTICESLEIDMYKFLD